MTFKPTWIKPFELGDHGPMDTVVADASGHFYFSDEINHRILKFRANGEMLSNFGSKGSGDKDLYYPMGLLIHEDHLLVCDSWNHRIQVYDTSGNLKQSLSGPDFKVPTDIQKDGDGALWLVQQEKEHLLIIHDPGNTEYLDKISLNYPRRLMVRNGCAAVLDCEKVVFLKDRNMTAHIPPPHPSHTDLLALNESGCLLLDRLGNRLLFFDSRSGALFPVHHFPNNVEIGYLNHQGLWIFGDGELAFIEADPEKGSDWWMKWVRESSPFLSPRSKIAPICIHGEQNFPDGSLPGDLLINDLADQTRYLYAKVEAGLDELKGPDANILTLETLYQTPLILRHNPKDALPEFRFIARDADGRQSLDFVRALRIWLQNASNCMEQVTETQDLVEPIKILVDETTKVLAYYASEKYRVCRNLSQILINDATAVALAVRADLQFFVLTHLQHQLFQFLRDLAPLDPSLNHLMDIKDEDVPSWCRALACGKNPKIMPPARSSKEALKASAEHMTRYYLTHFLIQENQNTYTLKVVHYLMSDEMRHYTWEDQIKSVPLYQLGLRTLKACFLAGLDCSHLEALFSQDPFAGDRQVRSFLAFYYAFIGDYGKMQSLVTGDSGTDQLVFLQCLAHTLQGRLEQGLDGLKTMENQTYYLYNQAYLHFLTGGYDQAEAKAAAFFQKMPDEMCNILMWALAIAYQGRFEEALTWYKEHSRFVGDAEVEQLFLGIFQRLAGEIQASIDTLSTLPDKPMAAYHLGVSLRLAGREDQALNCFYNEETKYACYLNALQISVTRHRLNDEPRALEALRHLTESQWLPWMGRRIYAGDPELTNVIKQIAALESCFLDTESRTRQSSEILASLAVFHANTIFNQPYDWLVVL